jgi:hypothetical protein
MLVLLLEGDSAAPVIASAVPDYRCLGMFELRMEGCVEGRKTDMHLNDGVEFPSGRLGEKQQVWLPPEQQIADYCPDESH